MRTATTKRESRILPIASHLAERVEQSKLATVRRATARPPGRPSPRTRACGRGAGCPAVPVRLRTIGKLVGNLHDLLQVVGVLVFDVTAREDEDTQEDRMTLAKARTGVNPVEGMETMALTIAHRLQEFNAAHRGDQREKGQAD